MALGIVVLSSATVAAAAVMQSDGDQADGSLTGTAEGSRAYYGNARASLSPLIVHVRDLPQALAALSGGKRVPNGLRDQAEVWIEDFANARDLVGRVAVPVGLAGAHVGVLYQSAAMLYTEAARLAVAAVDTRSVERRTADALLGQHLYVLGDRMFDSAFRLLNSTGALSESELHFPGPVPDFESSPTGAVAPTMSEEIGAIPTEWARVHGSDVRALGARMSRPPAAASELIVRQAALAAPVVGEDAQEAVTGMRLAALTLGEAQARRGAGLDHETTHRLTLLAARIWSSSAGLFPTKDFRQLSSKAPADESALYVGGFFNGNPPRLAPGDDPGKGLPGGLPPLDPQVLLGG